MVASESGHGDCCPLVVDTKTLLTMLAFLAAATYFLYVDITMNIMGTGARTLRAAPIVDQKNQLLCDHWL